MIILTHRGLDPETPNHPAESSCESFAKHLERGYGLEFDVCLTRDKKMIISHDISLERITGGKNKSLILELESEELRSIRIGGGKHRFCFLDELLEMIRKNNSPVCFLHLKYKFQEREYLNILAGYLDEFKDIEDKIIIFDVKIETAAYLKKINKNLMLAPSVAHPYDIKRYNDCVGGTLINLGEAIENSSLFDWIWLDGWDRNDERGVKEFYTEEVFNLCRKNNFKIALVTPELHAVSPGLLGGESHQDARNKKILFERIKAIIALKPDAICTDYPDSVHSLLQS